MDYKENVLNTIKNIIGEKETNKFIELLKNNYLEFDEEGYISNEYYVDYKDEEGIEDWVQNNYNKYSNFESLQDNFLEENFYNYDIDIEYFKNIRGIIYCLDVDSTKKEELENYIFEHYYIDYSDAINTLARSTIKIEISLQSDEDRNTLDGKQLIKKYIPKNLYKEIIKNDYYFYYGFVLCTNLKLNIQDYYNLNSNKFIELDGTFTVKDYHNGACYEELDGIQLKIKVNTKNLQFDCGYSIEEITGEFDYYLSDYYLINK